MILSKDEWEGIICTAAALQIDDAMYGAISFLNINDYWGENYWSEVSGFGCALCFR